VRDFPVFPVLVFVFCRLVISCASNAVSAEEFYSIGMAYYDIGKYEEAQKWLERASSVKKTTRASEYNLGRIAFETKKYTIAKKHFEKILKEDPQNVMALKAVAYTEIMLGDIKGAEKHYEKVLALEPENTDDGYNYALILYAMEKYGEAEKVLKVFSYNMPDNKNTLLLLARTEAAQKKPEAIDDYALWLVKNTDPAVRYEYAGALEEGEYFTRAIDELKKALSEWSADTKTLKKSAVQFALARLIMIADPKNEEGAKNFDEAITGGFEDIEVLRTLAADKRLDESVKSKVENAIASLMQKAQARKEEEEAAKKAEDDETGEEPEDDEESGFYASEQEDEDEDSD